MLAPSGLEKHIKIDKKAFLSFYFFVLGVLRKLRWVLGLKVLVFEGLSFRNTHHMHCLLEKKIVR